MREIKYIVIHCTATPQDTTIQSILNYWKNVLKWKHKGYHFIIEKNGNIEYIQSIKIPSNGVRGHNYNSIHISYIGGIDTNGKPKDTRTENQKKSLKLIIKLLKSLFPKSEILGHRDFQGVKKACPSFNAKKEYSQLKTFY